MDSITPTNTEELNAADEQLRALEAEQAAELEGAGLRDKTDDTNLPAERAAEGDKGGESELKTKNDAGTLPEAEKQELDTAKAEAEKEGKELALDDKGLPKRDDKGKFIKQDKKVEEPPLQLTVEEKAKFDKYLAQKSGSKYGKDFTRRLVTWTELNAEKEKLKTAQAAGETALKGAIAKFNADVQAFQTERQSQTPTPEKYDAFATRCAQDAKVKLADAIVAENEGRIEEAEKLRDEAKFLNRDAAAAQASAEHLRKNPPPNQQQQQEKFVSDQKGWIGKAATDFPDFGKKDSDLQKAVAENFKAITAANPSYARIPDLVYYITRLSAAELASAKVPALNKELGELRTKVKDLEALTNPTPGGSVQRASAGAKSFSQMTPDEQYEALQAEAASMR